MIRERLLLGAPGVYPVADDPVRALTGVRMDVAAFVGVAPRGPARLPAFAAPWATPPRGPANPTAELRSVAVPVESWSAYRRLFGTFEGPGLLPYAVAAFFEQGGRRAYVVRVVHDYAADVGGDPEENGYGTASGIVPGVTRRPSGDPLVLRARNEGSWGNRLRATLSFRTRPLRYDLIASTTAELVLLPDAPVPAGTLLRFWDADGEAELRFVSAVRDEWEVNRPVRERRATLEQAATIDFVRAEIVEADLAVTDLADDGIDRAELHEGMGLSAQHPRWMAYVLYRDSALVHPHPDWIGEELEVDDRFLRPVLPPPSPQFTCGRNRYAHLVPADFFDDRWTPGDEEPRSGVHALVEVEDVSIVCVPDLYSPGPLVAPESADDVVSLAGPEFAPCVELPASAEVEEEAEVCTDGRVAEPDGPASLDGLALDPLDPGELDEISELQQDLIELAESLRQWIVLLDVPPGLTQRQVLQWRARFGTAWAAAYHPWLRVARPDDAREPLVSVPPSAFAAGVVAWQELAHGVPHGPANVTVVGAVSVLDRVSPRRHDELHQSAVNVFLPERDGVRLTAARTLSRDPLWRQLSVRRLVTLLGRTLMRQMQWAAFEPNNALLRDELKRMLESFLGQLFRGNAFRGKTPEEAYFVRCDEGLNPPQVVDEGKLLCHVGVAPAEPLEFIVLKLSREGDGTLLMEE